MVMVLREKPRFMICCFDRVKAELEEKAEACRPDVLKRNIKEIMRAATFIFLELYRVRRK
jgi:hypothetical protein